MVHTFIRQITTSVKMRFTSTVAAHDLIMVSEFVAKKLKYAYCCIPVYD